MSLTRKFLEGIGIDEKQIEAILEGHGATVDGLKAERDKYKAEADKVQDLEKKIGEYEKAKSGSEDWEKKYNDEHKAFDDYKTQVANEKTKAEKSSAYRNMLISLGIDQRRIDSIMKVTDLSDVLLEDGAIKDIEKHQEKAKSDWADFIVKSKTVGSEPATPPDTTGGIKGADPDITKQIQARHERLYGKVESKEG